MEEIERILNEKVAEEERKEKEITDRITSESLIKYKDMYFRDHGEELPKNLQPEEGEIFHYLDVINGFKRAEVPQGLIDKLSEVIYRSCEVARATKGEDKLKKLKERMARENLTHEEKMGILTEDLGYDAARATIRRIKTEIVMLEKLRELGIITEEDLREMTLVSREVLSDSYWEKNGVKINPEEVEVPELEKILGSFN